MAGGVIQGTVRQTSDGAALAGASVRIRNEAGGANATIYSDAALTSTTANPMTADADGFFRCYVAKGKYRVTATSGAFTRDLRNIPVGDGAERDTGTDADDVVLMADADSRFLNSASNLSDVGSTATARANLGLGTMAQQNSIAVDIEGGDIVIDFLYVQGNSQFGGTFGDTGDNFSVEIQEILNAVNHLRLSGATTGNGPVVEARGANTDIALLLQAKGAGLVTVNGDSVRIVTAKTPASAVATGTQGQFCWDADYLYICIATDTWRRIAHSTW